MRVREWGSEVVGELGTRVTCYMIHGAPIGIRGHKTATKGLIKFQIRADRLTRVFFFFFGLCVQYPIFSDTIKLQ